MKAYWTLGIVMAGALQAQPVDCSVQVYVLARAPMRAGMLTTAKKTAAGMFGEIGVEVRVWSGIPAEPPGNACGAPIVIQIENAAVYRGNEEALAYATPRKQAGVSIHIFIDRVASRLNRDPAFANTLLAHVMVHEISHVLEGRERHSATGVMKAVWSEGDYSRMKDEPLSFAAEDVELIRQGLVKRVSDVRTK